MARGASVTNSCRLGDVEVAEVVREVADSFNLVGGDGQLLPLDSLTLVDVLVALEQRLSVQIPPEIISIESFASIESIVAMVEQAR